MTSHSTSTKQQQRGAHGGINATTTTTHQNYYHSNNNSSGGDRHLEGTNAAERGGGGGGGQRGGHYHSARRTSSPSAEHATNRPHGGGGTKQRTPLTSSYQGGSSKGSHNYSQHHQQSAATQQGHRRVSQHQQPPASSTWGASSQQRSSAQDNADPNASHVTIRKPNGSTWYQNQPYSRKPLPLTETATTGAFQRARSAGQPRGGGSGDAAPSVNYCRHYLLGQCNRGTMCRFAHLEQHTVVVRESREGKPLRAHSCTPTPPQYAHGSGGQPYYSQRAETGSTAPPPPPFHSNENEDGAYWGEDDVWYGDDDANDNEDDDENAVMCSTGAHAGDDAHTHYFSIPSVDATDGSTDFVAFDDASVLPAPPLSSSTSSMFPYKVGGGASGRHYGYGQQQQLSHHTASAMFDSATALYTGHRGHTHYVYGPTPSPDSSHNASFSHNPYPPTSLTLTVPPSCVSAAGGISPSGSVRVHQPYSGVATANTSPSCRAGLFSSQSVTPSEDGGSDEGDRFYDDEEDYDERAHDVSPSPASVAPHMPARSNTEVFADDDVTAAQHVLGDQQQQQLQQRASADFQSCDDGGECATASLQTTASSLTPSLSTSNSTQHTFPSQTSPSTQFPQHSCALHYPSYGTGSNAAALQAGRSPTINSATPNTSVQASPSIQPSLFSQLPAGYDEEEMDLLLLPSAHIDAAKFAAHQRAFSLMVGPMHVSPGPSGLAHGGAVGNPNQVSPEQQYASVTSLPSSLTRYPSAAAVTTVYLSGMARSGEVASSSEHHTPHSTYQQVTPFGAAGKQSPVAGCVPRRGAHHQNTLVERLWPLSRRCFFSLI